MRCLSSGHKAGVVYYVTTCLLLPSLRSSPICLYLSFSLFICICICLSLPKILPIYLSHSFSPAAFLPSFPYSQPWLANDGLSDGLEWWILWIRMVDPSKMNKTTNPLSISLPPPPSPFNEGATTPPSPNFCLCSPVKARAEYKALVGDG